MSTMLPEALRWRPPSRSGTPGSRWAAWSRSLSDRHGRIAGHHRRLALTLARPLGLMLLHSQRWQHVAWTLSPRINLVLGPVLQPAGWRTFVLQPSAIGRVLVRRLGDGRLAGQSQPDVRPVAPGQAAGFVSTARESLALGLPREAGPSPVRRVFARLHVGETVAQASQSQIVRAGRAMVQRIVQEHQRIEMRITTRVVAREQRNVTSDFAPVEGQRPTAESRFGMSKGAHPVGQAMAASPIAIQQLTEQVVREIDRRLVAQRERMGKL